MQLGGRKKEEGFVNMSLESLSLFVLESPLNPPVLKKAEGERIGSQVALGCHLSGIEKEEIKTYGKNKVNREHFYLIFTYLFLL